MLAPYAGKTARDGAVGRVRAVRATEQGPCLLVNMAPLCGGRLRDRRRLHTKGAVGGPSPSQVTAAGYGSPQFSQPPPPLRRAVGGH